MLSRWIIIIVKYRNIKNPFLVEIGWWNLRYYMFHILSNVIYNLILWFIPLYSLYNRLFLIILELKYSLLQVYEMSQNGGPKIKAMLTVILENVTRSIFEMISLWIYDGRLPTDTNQEFFITVYPSVGRENLWAGKYCLRKGMIPEYISKEQARKVRVCSAFSIARRKINLKISILIPKVLLELQ